MASRVGYALTTGLATLTLSLLASNAFAAANCAPTQTLPALQAADLRPQLVATGLTCQASAAPDTVLVAYTVPGRPARHKALPEGRPLNPIFASKFASHPNRALPPVSRRYKSGTPARSRSNTDGARYGEQWQSRNAYEHGSYARDADEDGDSNHEETGAYDDVNADNYASHFAPRHADVYPQQRRVYDRGSNDNDYDAGDESRAREKYDYSPYANGASGLYGDPYNPSYAYGYRPNPPPDETARAYRDNSASRLTTANSPESDGGFENFYSNFLAEHEGGYTASDGNGSPANFGINQGANPDIDVSNLTPEEAKQILHDRYWIASGADQLPAALAAVHGDTAVNMGVDAANELLAQSGDDPQIYLALREERYRSIAASNSDKAKNLPTWLARNEDLRNFIKGGGLRDQEPTYTARLAPTDAAAEQHWYYCNAPKGYYPYVTSCSNNWQAVSPTLASQWSR